MRNTADDDHRMGSEHVGKDVPTKPGEIEYTDRRIFVTGPQVVDLGLVLHRTIDTYSPFQSPLHVTKETTQVKALLLTTREDFLERRKLSVEIEVFVAQICISPAMQLELPAALRCCDVDAGDVNGCKRSSHRPGLTIRDAFSPHWNPSLMQGRVTRYSSSGLLKNAQT